MATENIHFDCYVDHRETIPFDEIVLYSGWLAASSTIIVHYLSDHVMHKFGYQQTITHMPSDPVIIAMTYWQLDEVFVDWEHHMVPNEAQTTRLEVDWSCVDGYITWYYKVSHPYMFPTAPGSPPRPTHEKILRVHQAQIDHTEDVLPRCREITDMT
ncbi:uncharacterized protein LOC131638819 [Vicia villosa]|uniref:uncharacterized protein LOC131638819 n=1 Tax=Vicia villosa TaxID=3911 RepID=UPI00273BA606|nr:uncharacterized protein LOC131638819 [Vicia villosa]